MDLKNLTSLIDLSENIKKTPEGYLLCLDVCLTLVGEMLYGVEEFKNPAFVPNSEGMIKLIRTADALNNPDTLGSFIGKPITFNHPAGGVYVDNWKDYAIGVINNPRYDEKGGIFADILITEPAAIELVTNGIVRQVSSSVNYTPQFVEAGIVVATMIRCNHVALVREGRAGAACMINDSKQEVRMGGIKDKLAKIMSMFTDLVSGIPDEVSDAAAIEEVKKDVKEKGAAEAKDAAEVVEEDVATDKGDCDEMAMDSKFVSKDEFKESMSELKALIKDSFAVKETARSTASDAALCDEITMAKAEVLSPGIHAQKDIKRVALDEAMQTEDGKEVITSIASDGVTDANLDAVFNAAYVMLKERRNRKAINSLNDAKYNEAGKDYFSPRAMNENNIKFWEKRGVK